MRRIFLTPLLNLCNRRTNIIKVKNDRFRPISPHSTISTPPSSPKNNRSVNFAPLSPKSSRRLTKTHKDHQEPLAQKSHSTTYDPDPTREDYDDMIYDDPSSPTSPIHRRRRRRRNSDPSSNRPSQPSEHRRRRKNPTRSPSPSSPEVEILPDRFDKNGRPIRQIEQGPQSEMVERIARDFGDVVGGKKTWRDLLSGVIGEAGRNRP